MKKARHPSSGKLVLCVILYGFGMIGLMQTSFVSISALLFAPPSDQFMFLRVAIILVVSVLLIAGSAKLGKDTNWHKNNLWKVPFIVVFAGCLGLINTISNFYEHRQPHSLTEYEISLLIISIAVVAICFWWLYQSQKKSAKAAGQFTPSNAEIITGRILRPAPRPYVALGIVFGVVGLIAIVPIVVADKPLEAMKAASCMLVLYGLICLIISGQKIIVGNDYIAFKSLGKSASAVYFNDISRSVRHILAERQHPLNLDVYTHGHQMHALRIPLKPFRQPDVAWLLSIPEMKVQK